MLTTTPWRTALEHVHSPMTVRALHVGERAAMEEVALRQRVTTAAEEYRRDTDEPHAGYKSDTWFYPVERDRTMGFYDVVLGWNHAVVLQPVGRQLYAVRWILAYTADRLHQVHGGVGVDVREAGVVGAWTVYQPRQQPMLRRVTTYNATTCSVSVVFPSDGQGTVLMSHIDATPPIPWGIALAWCDRAERRGLRLEPPRWGGVRLRAISSVCPDRAELAKFRDDVCLAGGTQALAPPFVPHLGPPRRRLMVDEDVPRIIVTPPPRDRAISTVALCRGVVPLQGVGPCEFNTQAGLVFERDQAPRFRVFLGSPPMLYLGLVPLEVQLQLEQLNGKFPSLQELHRRVLAVVRDLKDLDQTFWVSDRAKKRTALVDRQQDAAMHRDEVERGLEATATEILRPLLDGTHGLRGLHRAIYNAFAGTPFARARLINHALTSPQSIEAVTVQREITAYFRVVDLPVTAVAHQALIDNA